MLKKAPKKGGKLKRIARDDKWKFLSCFFFLFPNEKKTLSCANYILVSNCNKRELINFPIRSARWPELEESGEKQNKYFSFSPLHCVDVADFAPVKKQKSRRRTRRRRRGSVD